jgi:hypothetical protein
MPLFKGASFMSAQGLAVLAAALLLTAVATAAPEPALPALPAVPEAAHMRLRRLELPQQAGQLAYYVSRQSSPRSALLVMHGYPRDATRSFKAGWAAVQAAGLQDRVLVVAPLFQVEAEEASRCQTAGEPPAQAGDALWRCGGWLAGDRSSGSQAISSFAALDALVVALLHQWPSLRSITLAGFSAGAQLLQHYAGFAADAPVGVRLRYVIADPGTWLYFDAVRPTAAMQAPEAANCPHYNQWKYGSTELPPGLGRDADAARARYRAAELVYVAGALDNGPGPGTADRLLDHSCAAQWQGPYRLQRAQGYLAYEREVLKPTRPRGLTVVQGCAHSVVCVLTSPEVRARLFDEAP